MNEKATPESTTISNPSEATTVQDTGNNNQVIVDISQSIVDQIKYSNSLIFCECALLACILGVIFAKVIWRKM